MEEMKEILMKDNSIEKDYSKLTSLEHRKKFAQYFTPYPLASLMASWILNNSNLKTVLEPAIGLGVFSRALLERNDIKIKGFEIDNTILTKSKEIFADYDNIDFILKDYMFNDWDNKYDGIICNPPYFKFHNYDNKTIIKEIGTRLSIKLNGFTNLYSLFLLKSIHQLNKNGRLAYIVPSEFLNSDYGKLVKTELIKKKILRHLIIIDFKEKVFDDALTTASILLCSNDTYSNRVKFTYVNKLTELNKVEELIANYPVINDEANTYFLHELSPDVKWRKYYQKQKSTAFKNLIPFARVGKVVRGIATGANDYFTFSKSKAVENGINDKYLLPCICKALDVKNKFFTKNDFVKLVNNNRKVFLFDAIGSNEDKVKDYIKKGEKLGIHQKYLTSCRTPWYSIENRPPAPIWVSVFNRTGLKFIRNEANISNLTTFHCIYPVQSNLFDNIKIDLLFAYLITDVAKEIFEDNSREYGNGLQKFEPNDLNKAQMLDLTMLDKKNEQDILNLYYQYRETVLNSSPDETLVEKINEIFISIYSHSNL
ncbi:adenine-specific DNA-methyltransferase [Tangfeifania diversioriginum]|uniref:site-specific DNA-methyltransferase (adenine-specific) n=1 Tax=Tangfeifania diversioriginum TaxID=1168035 RepID=A0A1M6HF26_9BACT|nr:Eco57I restriction-modification methylase domain-containing protein [Tangfeifania diversioriginum]SHJ20756.1 adenine-specific DNA-methyltransferase [Tangfeifania diversioriginum]